MIFKVEKLGYKQYVWIKKIFKLKYNMYIHQNMRMINSKYLSSSHSISECPKY